MRYSDGLQVRPDTLNPLFTLGRYADDSSVIFEDLRDIAVASDGHIYALDNGAHEIRVFTATGAPDTVLSRQGEGPGEIRNANGLRFDNGGQLWVNDYGQRAMLVLDPAGIEQARHRGIVPGYGYRWTAVIDTAGVMWEPWSRQVSGGEPDLEATGLVEGRSIPMFLSYDPTTDSRDSISFSERTFRSYRAAFGSGQMVTGLPFAPRAFLAMDRQRRVWASLGDPYALVRMNSAGDTTLQLHVAEAGAAVTADDIAAWQEQRREEAEQFQMPDISRDLMQYMPTTKPALVQLLVDDNDRLWVGRSVPEGERPRWDVFSSEGELLAVVRGPVEINSFLQPVVNGDRIYLIADGEAGERYIVVAELPASLQP